MSVKWTEIVNRWYSGKSIDALAAEIGRDRAEVEEVLRVYLNGQEAVRRAQMSECPVCGAKDDD